MSVVVSLIVATVIVVGLWLCGYGTSLRSRRPREMPPSGKNGESTRHLVQQVKAAEKRIAAKTDSRKEDGT